MPGSRWALYDVGTDTAPASLYEENVTPLPACFEKGAPASCSACFWRTAGVPAMQAEQWHLHCGVDPGLLGCVGSRTIEDTGSVAHCTLV